MYGGGPTNFKVPDEERRKLALGSLAGTHLTLKKALLNPEEFYQPINPPGSSDWLAEHDEDGQTYDSFASSHRNLVDKNHNTIYIAPLQEMSQEFLNQCLSYCKLFFLGMNVKIFKKLNLKSLGIKSRINENTNLIQYHAGEILSKASQHLKKSSYCMICILYDDLYPKEEWNFVFGLASSMKRTGVFSFARYKAPFIPETEDTQGKLFYRAIKVMTHEIGHMFNLKHCIYYKCLMNGSNHFEEFESKPGYLCGVCLRKLQLAIGFVCQDREKLLCEECLKNGIEFIKLTEFYSSRLNYFENKSK